VKIDFDGSSYIYRLAVTRRRLKAPLEDRFHGFFVLTLVKARDNLWVANGALVRDNDLNAHNAAGESLFRFGVKIGFDNVDELGRLDIAANVIDGLVRFAALIGRPGVGNENETRSNTKTNQKARSSLHVKTGPPS
jgi:hypothetical protein